VVIIPNLPGVLVGPLAKMICPECGGNGLVPERQANDIEQRIERQEHDTIPAEKLSPEDRVREALFTALEAVTTYHVLIHDTLEEYKDVVAFASKFSVEERKTLIKYLSSAKGTLNDIQRATGAGLCRL
jgi:hypothetical protein